MIRPQPTGARFQVTCLLGLITLSFGCGGGGSDVGPDPTPSAIAVVSGTGQSGEAGSALAQPLVIQVTSSSGAGVEGAAVTFTPGASSGSVSAGQATTDGDGRASINWTVGTGVGANIDTVYARVSGVTAPAVFTATVNAAGAASIEQVSGNGQNGFPAQPLTQPLVVLVRDRYGNPKSQVGVTWVVTSGGGTISPGTSTTGSDGQASASWTIGSIGANAATADAAGLTGSPIAFNATALDPSAAITLLAISPTPLVEGQSATLTGTGFSPSPAGNTVKIDAVDANVTAATPTSLTIQVPGFNCQPARRAQVQVRVGGQSSNVLEQDLNPAAFTTVAVGQQLVLQTPQQYCLQFAPRASPEDYLIGIQSTSDAVSSLTPARLTAVAAPGQPSTAPLAQLARRSTPARQFSGLRDSRVPMMQRRAAAEARLRAEERQQVLPLLSQMRSRQLSLQRAAAIPPVVQPGDQVPINFPGPNNTCTSVVAIQTVVRVIGQYGIWLEDQDNPAGGLTQADIQRLSDEFDSRIYPTVTGYFGVPTDIDQNGKIAVVLTGRINELYPDVAGLVTAADLVPRSVCASSDEGEVYYSFVPDPTGELGGPISREAVLHVAVQTIAHEFTHLIQFGQRHILHDNPPHPVWMIEGQAMLAEEITGHAYEGRSPGQNYGIEIVFNEDDPSSLDWYFTQFLGLFLYYGYRDDVSRVPNAPEQCSWLARKPENPGPCTPGLEVYGPPWALLRWMSDQFGRNYPDGEGGLHRALILSPSEGYGSLAEVSGVPIQTLLAQWAATLYVDDRVPAAAASLQLPSWNLLDVENGVVESARLVPRSRSFAGFTDAFSVRAGSTAYFRVSGATHPGTAIRIRTPTDQPLSSIMQVFVVRLQ